MIKNQDAVSMEDFVKSVYCLVDEAAAGELERLRREEGIIAMCKMGCCSCCRYHILVNIAEARTLAQYIKQEFSPDQINAVQARTRRWHQWDNSRPGRRHHPENNSAPQMDFSSYEHCCPLLVEGVCSAYPVRPVVCRTHFVSSHPVACAAANDPQSTLAPPTVLTSVVTAAAPFIMAIRDRIQNEGMDFSRTAMLMPHSLAAEMGWDFDSLFRIPGN